MHPKSSVSVYFRQLGCGRTHLDEAFSDGLLSNTMRTMNGHSRVLLLLQSVFYPPVVRYVIAAQARKGSVS